MPDLAAILDDLRAEHRALEELVVDLNDAGWEKPTPAEGWNIRDQIGHLAFFDEQAALALRDQDAFSEGLQEIARDVGMYMDRSIQRGRELGNDGVLEWWRDARVAMLDAAQEAEPQRRIPWYGAPMSPASFFSARIMETWAHGQDVADALGVTRTVHDRLRHVAHLCVLARPFSYATHGLPRPTNDVRVELVGPNGDMWAWGNPAARDRISGAAEDFCLVAVQRRHPDDTDLAIEGDGARTWMSVAQAYAGPPGPGRRPGQFPRAERSSGLPSS